MIRLTKAAAIAALVLAAPGAALAHAQLRTSQPAADSTVPSPKVIKADFSEAVVAKFSGIDLKDAAGHAVALAPMTALGSRWLASEPKAPLKPGRYTVEWHVVSADTHRTTGSYSFTVK